MISILGKIRSSHPSSPSELLYCTHYSVSLRPTNSPLLRLLLPLRGVRGLLGGVPAHVPPHRGREGPDGLRGALHDGGAGLPQVGRRRLQVSESTQG